MEVNCLGCGFKVDLTEAYDDYVGQIKCFACGATMEIAAHKGEIEAVTAVAPAPLVPAEEFAVRNVE